MESFITKQIKTRGAKVRCSKLYEHTDEISGLFLSSCIRFYREEPDFSIESVTAKNPKATKKQIRMIRRVFYSNSDYFDVKNDYIYLNSYGSNEPGKGYDFKSGIIVVESSKFMDVVTKSNLSKYLEEFGFDEECKDEILSEETTEIKRNPVKKLTYNIGMPYKEM